MLKYILAAFLFATSAAAKQDLRDITAYARIEAATTPEELKTLTLDVLISS